MMKIREVYPGDAHALKNLYLFHLTARIPEEQPDDSRWLPAMQEIVDDPNYHLLVCEADGQVVSTVTLVLIKNLTHDFRPYAIIENVVTHESCRGRGYASALMERASEIAKTYGCYKIVLTTGSQAESTLKFYENCGFNRHDKTAFIKWL